MEEAINSIGNFLFHANDYQCSASAYGFLYCVLAVIVVVSSGGAYVWRRMFVHQESRKSEPKAPESIPAHSH